MNKLRKKTFWTLLIILSTFLISILSIFTYQSYNREKIDIEQNLFRMNKGFDKIPQNKDAIPKLDSEKIPNESIKEDNHRRFMDTTIYTILLDDNNNILEIISHTEDGIVNTNVEEIALRIIEENNKSTTYIGNLYINNYSYRYEENNHITLIDTHDVKERLTASLKIVILSFILAEIIIISISKILSEWIIKPVEISFNKQKQFVADASHELKTPLSVIIACAETLENNPKEHKWLDNIKTESDRMSKLITNLLDLAKVENETNKELYEKVNLSKLVEKAILPFESLAYEKNIKLDYEIKDNINFKCNSEEINELLSIMLDNAVKHSSKKGNIIVNLTDDKNNIILEVINKGDPIPKGEEEKIFERFYRVDKSRNRNDNRYGLGLAIAKSIVENHNGKISAASNNEYTTFKVILKK